MKSDIQIAREADIRPIKEIAEKLGLSESDLEFYGPYKAKLPLRLIDEEKVKKAKLVLVTAITPTPAGEGKTTTSIGLAQALNHIGKKATVVIREPSLGPVFGIKGGAAGGGFSQVIPMEDINLHFTGDLSAIEKAHNLLAALIDNNINNTENLGIDPRTIQWKRVMDMNERALRKIVIGLGGTTEGVPRETGFNITAASEVMSVLCLSKNLKDLKERLGNIFVGLIYEGKPIFARDLKAHGAMAVLLKDAIKPNLVQTIENTPAIIHGGPFANIAQGTNTLIATKMGLTLSEFVVTEAGFASDLGAEKFFDIKCRVGSLQPNAVVIVATIRALKYHGKQPLSQVAHPNVQALKAGLPNLDKHIENMRHFGFEPVVAINKFVTDSLDEIEAIKAHCLSIGIKVAMIDSWAQGGKGAIELAEKVVESVNNCPRCFNPLYDYKWTVEQKVEAIAKKMYGAGSVQFGVKAKKDLKLIDDLHLNELAICIAKTQKSLSDDPKLKGRPEGFVVKIREIEIAAGAGFLVPIAGDIMRMPGLPTKPSAELIDIDDDGNISGLF